MTTLQHNLSTTTEAQAPRRSGRNGTWGRGKPNISSRERVTSLLVGSGLALGGLRRMSFPGLLVAGIGAELMRRGLSKHSRLYDRLGIDRSDRAAPPEEYFERGIHVEQSLTINKDPMELYRFWRDLDNLPRIMDHLESVAKLDDRRSHWVVLGPMGHTVEWDAELINDEPGRLLAWRSLRGASVDNAGSVRFVPAPGNRGTEVRVVLDYVPPAGRAGALVARMFGKNPRQQILEDLRHFKQVMEAGEIPTTKGQPRGTCRH